MKSTRPAFHTGFRLAAAGGSLALLAALSGCAVGTAPTSQSALLGTITGSVHGGQQPINGAAIQLYSVGTTGYGTGATALITATVTTDASGSFSITGDYTCPDTTTLVYLTATGGDPGGGTNDNSKLMVALGQCGNLTSATRVQVNEVTTAAAAFALTPYFTQNITGESTDGFGAPNNTQAAVGIANAFTTATTLANIFDGSPTTTRTTSGAGGGITITTESDKLYTIADILAACVNSTGVATDGSKTSCGTLFADSGPTGVTPVNTLQAAVLLNRNPTSSNANGSANNLTALYQLISPAAPYPSVAAQPTDWTLGVLYTSTTADANGINNMYEPQNIAIDAAGNVWVINNGSSTGGSLNKITPDGTMTVFNNLNGTDASGAAVAGNTLNPRNLAIDQNNNIWIPTSSGSAYGFEYTSAGTLLTPFKIGKSAYGVAVDKNNNIWFSHASSTNLYAFDEYVGAVPSASAQISYGPVIGATTNLSQYIAFDVNGALWVANGTNNTSNTNVTKATFDSSSCTAFPCTTGVGTYTNVTGLGADPFAPAADATSMWFGDAGGNTISNVTLTTPAATNYGTTTSLNAPRFPAIDGNGNVWVSNRGSGAISEFSSAGAVLSPVPTGTNTTPIGFAHAGLASANQLAIDPSGNIWVANNTTTTTTGDANSIFEIVGAATPTITPLATQVKNGSFGTAP